MSNPIEAVWLKFDNSSVYTGGARRWQARNTRILILRRDGSITEHDTRLEVLDRLRQNLNRLAQERPEYRIEYRVMDYAEWFAYSFTFGVAGTEAFHGKECGI